MGKALPIIALGIAIALAAMATVKTTLHVLNQISILAPWTVNKPAECKNRPALNRAVFLRLFANGPHIFQIS